MAIAVWMRLLCVLRSIRRSLIGLAPWNEAGNFLREKLMVKFMVGWETRPQALLSGDTRNLKVRKRRLQLHRAWRQSRSWHSDWRTAAGTSLHQTDCMVESIIFFASC